MPQYQIVGADLQAVVCNLSPGESVIAETGHLLSLSDGLELQTHTAGGIWSGIKRSFGGSSFFVNEITAGAPGQAIFASPTPGKIQELDVNPTLGWLCQPHVFLCSDRGIQQSAALTQSFGAGLFGGSGFLLQSLTGQGKAFVHVGGACLKYHLAAGQSLRIETGALAAFESTVAYDIQMVRGLKSILFSGEGLWFAHLKGPGTVYIQSLALPRFAHALAPYLPHVQASQEGAAGAIGGLIGSILKKQLTCVPKNTGKIALEARLISCKVPDRPNPKNRLFFENRSSCFSPSRGSIELATFSSSLGDLSRGKAAPFRRSLN